MVLVFVVVVWLVVVWLVLVGVLCDWAVGVACDAGVVLCLLYGLCIVIVVLSTVGIVACFQFPLWLMIVMRLVVFDQLDVDCTMNPLILGFLVKVLALLGLALQHQLVEASCFWKMHLLEHTLEQRCQGQLAMSVR